MQDGGYSYEEALTKAKDPNFLLREKGKAVRAAEANARAEFTTLAGMGKKVKIEEILAKHYKLQGLPPPDGSE